MHMHMRTPRPCADTHTHTHTPLSGYGLSTGPTDGLSSWWLRNRSPPDSQQQPTTTHAIKASMRGTIHVNCMNDHSTLVACISTKKQMHAEQYEMCDV